MAITSTQPINLDGVVYDKYAVNLALSTLLMSGQLNVAISVRLTPYRDTEDGPDLLNDAAKAIVIGEAQKEAQGDADVAAFLSAIEAAGQAFLTAKGI